MATPNSEDIAEREPLNTTSDNIDDKKKKRTLCEFLNSVKRNITVEPVTFLALFAAILSGIASQTLGLEKTCRVSLNLTDEICDSLRIQNQSNNFSVYERMVQEHYSAQLVWKSALQSLLPCVMLLFVGGWSDKTGRRIVVMLIPLIGDMLQCTSNIINVILFYQIPLEVFIFFDTFFIGIAGGSTVMFVAAFNYLCDITTEKNRTHRLGLVNLCTVISVPMGLALSGVMLRHLGYYAMYGSALTLHVFNLMYIVFRLSDPPRSEEQKMHDGQGAGHFFRTFFNLSTIKDTVMVVCKKTAGNRRLRLCVLLFTVTILYGPIHGETSVIYMSTRYRFNWDEVKFSIFQTYNFIANGIGTIFSITVFSKCLQWHDSILGITSGISKIASSFLYCFAPNEKIFFIGPIVDIFNGTAVLAVRSIYSKLLEPFEIGKVNSLVGLIENLMPLMYVPLYTTVYTATIEVLPGAMYLLGAAMTFPSLFVFTWLLFEHRKDVRRETAEKSNGIPMS